MSRFSAVLVAVAVIAVAVIAVAAIAVAAIPSIAVHNARHFEWAAAAEV
jgi:hypothetical protein